MYVASVVRKEEKKEDKKKGEVSRRSTTLKYSIKTANGKTELLTFVRICFCLLLDWVNGLLLIGHQDMKTPVME